MRTRVPSLRWALAACTLVAAPEPSAACGGFFCNAPTPQVQLPVAQTAENVLFGMERAPGGRFKLEAHIQIFYTGPADRFSWVVPVDDKPELDVGHNRVFTALLAATAPTLTLNWRSEGTCLQPASGGAGGAGGSAAGGASGFADAGAAARDAAAGVAVAFRGDVGPFDAAVVRSSDPRDASALREWLRVNGYFVSDEGYRLIEEYAREEKWFVALKLLSGRGTNEIQPIVMRFEGPSPCVPLKLTSIAALRDLRVNLWVLGDNRVVPDNYYEIRINEARLDWLGAGRNYEELVKRAADEAGGNAFVTEYAGTARVLAGSVHRPGQYDLSGVRAARSPPAALAALAAAGVLGDAQLLAILRTHIPMPDVVRRMGVDEQTFYGQLSFYWQNHMRDFKPLDPVALAAEVDKKIVQPLVRAQALFDRHSKLTRLVTFISPEEMTLDPTFVMNPTLPDVPARRSATAVRLCNGRYTACEAPVRLELEDGRALLFNPVRGFCPPFAQRAASYERGELDAVMPALEIGWRRDPAGEGAVRFDNRASIVNGIRQHNLAASQSAPPPSGGGARADAGTGGTGGSGAGGAGALPQGEVPGAPRKASHTDGGEAAGGERPGAEEGARLAGGGCGCVLGGPAGGPGAAAGLVVLALIARRGRRRRW